MLKQVQHDFVLQEIHLNAIQTLNILLLYDIREQTKKDKYTGRPITKPPGLP